MNNKLISFITYEGLPNLDPDDRLVKVALENRGYRVQALVWDKPDIDWSKSGICILRSTWDYHKKYERFCKWICDLEKRTQLLNPASLLLWNSNKSYLQELADAALPVIPTEFVKSSKGASIKEILQRKSWQKAVIKPIVGLASSGALKVERNDAELDKAQKHLDLLLQESDAMVQEYMPSVAEYGERALSFIDGKFSHAVRKAPFQALAVAGAAGESPALASELEIETAKKILSYLKETPLYARVDLVMDKNQQAQLMELELVEPSLFLAKQPGSAELMADAIIKRVECS